MVWSRRIPWALLWLSLTFAGVPCHAQTAERAVRVGVMVNGAPNPLFDRTFERVKTEFAQLGYTEGKNIAYEFKFAGGQLDRHPEFAKQLVESKVDLIFASGAPSAVAAKNATSTIPIIFAIVTDPVAVKLADSMQRPGGNITGLTNLDPDQAKKQMQLLREALPKLARVAILSEEGLPGADASGYVPAERDNIAAARALGMEPKVYRLKGPTPDLQGTFAAIASDGNDAVLALEVPVVIVQRKAVVDSATARGLVTMLPGGLADAGAMITYGTSVFDTWARIPALADKIFKGAKAGDIPIEVVTRKELVVNQKTARAIGANVPASVLARADQVIE